jgi:hypothetical protein
MKGKLTSRLKCCNNQSEFDGFSKFVPRVRQATYVPVFPAV